jgi:carbon-monoxide dehydrogenase large subunit
MESVGRREDSKAVRALMGRGRFIDDIHLPEELHCCFLRSPVARGRIVSIEMPTSAPPGVMFFTGANLGGNVSMPRGLYRFPDQISLPFPALAEETVAFVGQPIAAALASSRALAEDAIEQVSLNIEEERPRVLLSSPAEVFGSVLPSATHDGPVQGVLAANYGTFVASTSRAGVVTADIHLGRAAAMPIETRGVLAVFDELEDALTVWLPTQLPSLARTWIAEALGMRASNVRVIVPDIGGSFGSKWHLYPEDLVVAALARVTRKPVRWIEDRYEHFVATVHAREQRTIISLDADGQGCLRGIRSRSVADQGAYFHTAGPAPAANSVYLASGPYRVPVVDAAVAVSITNKTPYGAYRGFGQEAAIFALERGMDLLARNLGVDPVALRRRNLLRPDELPYKTPTRQVLDSGDYARCLDLAAERIGYELTKPRPPFHGVGIAFYVENTGLASSKQAAKAGWTTPTFERVHLWLEPDGCVVVESCLVEMGQGIERTLAAIAAAPLGADPSGIEVRLGDTRSGAFSAFGTAASRGVVSGGAAVETAAERLRDEILRAASLLLEVPVDELTLADSRVFVRGDPTRSINLSDVARSYYGVRPTDLKGVELDVTVTYELKAPSFGYGTHAAEVSIDPDTGLVSIDRYVVVHDCGEMVDPVGVEGQISGGTAQGIGQALMESLTYDSNGQPGVVSFMDYLLPTSGECPNIEFCHISTPSPFTKSGRRGIGESGCVGAPAAIVAAVQDALPPNAPFLTSLPVHPAQLLAIIKECA